MSRRFRILLHLAAGLASMPGPASAQADRLKHDPFARPVLPALRLPAAPAPDNVAKAPMPGNVANVPAPEPAWKPDLSAVIVAGPNSIANVDGVMVRIGEEIQGHRLVEVHAGKAVFMKNKVRITISMRGRQEVRDAPSRQDDRSTQERRDDTREAPEK